MQVTRITELQSTRNLTQRKAVSTEMLQREFDYYRSLKLLRKMLHAGLISQEEFERIDRQNRLSFSPFGVELMP
mgnify:CR=1 FL=1